LLVPVKIGTAGWAIGSAAGESFPDGGSALERYSAVFPVAEINSSFHRPHRSSTWEKWRESTPGGFRFSVKIPKEISHQRKLLDCEEPLSAFMEQVACLKEKLAVVLLQLPPKLEFDSETARRFFALLRRSTDTTIVCEPRNSTWFGAEADAMLMDHQVARVAADPARVPGADAPGGWRGVSYWRLHGSPVMYRSSYADRIEQYANMLNREAAEARDVWCIFDNTASSAAISDALKLKSLCHANRSEPT
jgi:uncharacterized protein YecE (DUF72 family)